MGDHLAPWDFKEFVGGDLQKHGQKEEILLQEVERTADIERSTKSRGKDVGEERGSCG